MGIQEGGASVRRFMVLGEPSAELNLVATVSLRRDFWKPIDASRGEKESFGWVNPRNLLTEDFTWDDVQVTQGVALLGVRVDRKSFSPVLFKARLRDKMGRVREERKVERLSRAQRLALKEELTQQMLAETSPKSTFAEVLWEMNSGIVLMGGAGGALCERIADLFHRTFDLRLRPVFPSLMGGEFIASQGLEQEFAISTAGQE